LTSVCDILNDVEGRRKKEEGRRKKVCVCVFRPQLKTGDLYKVGVLKRAVTS
jgi:hypothetical protein